MDYHSLTQLKNDAQSRASSARLTASSAPSSPAGFTLLEMLVVIAIISVIIGVVVTNQRSFDNSIILSNTAYDVALSIRQAQAYGSAGHEVAGASSVNYGSGIDFNIIKKNKYTIFADTFSLPSSSCYSLSSSGPLNSPAQKSGDCVYTANKDQRLRTFTINNGITISKLCYKPTTGSDICVTPTTTSPSFNQLDITYSRGEVINHIMSSSSGGSSDKSILACIELASPDNSAHESITVTNAGTIFVERKICL